MTDLNFLSCSPPFFFGTNTLLHRPNRTLTPWRSSPSPLTRRLLSWNPGCPSRLNFCPSNTQQISLLSATGEKSAVLGNDVIFSPWKLQFYWKIEFFGFFRSFWTYKHWIFLYRNDKLTKIQRYGTVLHIAVGNNPSFLSPLVFWMGLPWRVCAYVCVCLCL